MPGARAVRLSVAAGLFIIVAMAAVAKMNASDVNTFLREKLGIPMDVCEDFEGETARDNVRGEFVVFV